MVTSGISAGPSTWRARFMRGVPRTFVHNAGWQYLSVVTVGGCGFLYTLVVGRRLGPSEFGRMALGLGFASLIFGLLQVRLHEAVIRFLTEFVERGEHDRALAVVRLSLMVDLAASGVAALLILALAPWARAHVLHDAQGVPIVELSALVQLTTNVGTATAIGVLRTVDQYRWHALVSSIGAAIKLVVTAVMLWTTDAGILTVLLIAAAAGLFSNGALLAGGRHWLRRRIGRPASSSSISVLKPRLGEMTRFVGSTYGASLSGTAFRDLDINLLGWLTRPEVAGTYRIAKNFVALLSQATDPILFAILPELSRFWVRREFHLLLSFVKRLTVLMAAAGVALTLVSAVAVPWAIHLFLGPRFAASAPIFLSMVWWVVIAMPVIWAHSLLCAAGRPSLSLWAGLSGTVLTIPLYLLLIPPLGGVGAGLAYASGLAVASLVTAFFAWRVGLSPARRFVVAG